MIEGRCLCGEVQFEISGDTTDIYECHCSVCRKATGTSGISVFVAEGDGFRWLAGEDQAQLYVAESGYRSVFCGNCGSPLPDPNPDKSKFWVPAGLIQGDTGKKIGAHIFVGSKANWHYIGDDGEQFEEHFPKVET